MPSLTQDFMFMLQTAHVVYRRMLSVTYDMYYNGHCVTTVDEEVDGDAYLGLSESILLNVLHLKAGQTSKILRHIASLEIVSVYFLCC